MSKRKNNNDLNKVVMPEIYMMSQDELRSYIMFILDQDRIPYYLLDGNIISINYKQKPIFVSHMDMISEETSTSIPLKYELGYLKRESPATLGADDRAGINIILNNRHHINFVITRDEESGGQGAYAIQKDEDFIKDCKDYGTCFVELDRKGFNEVLADVHGYCQEDLYKDFQKVYPTIESGYGIFTDIDAWQDILPGVNLAIGYYGAHTVNERLNVTEWLIVNNSIRTLNNTLTGNYGMPPEKWAYYPSVYNRKNARTQWSDYYGSYYEEDLTCGYEDYTIKKNPDTHDCYCDFCLESSDTVIFDTYYDGFLCNGCSESLYGEGIKGV